MCQNVELLPELLPFVVTINSLYCNFFITGHREKSIALFCSTICMLHPILRFSGVFDAYLMQLCIAEILILFSKYKKTVHLF